MDLITPARTWAAETPADDHAPHDRMPRLQQAVMFLSVAGPITGLLIAIDMLWHSGSWGIGWPEVVAMIVMYSLTGFAVTIGFHRLLTHKSFETVRPIKLFLAVIGSSAGQGMCIRWCATHRRHHQQADRDGDPHSPRLHGDGMLALIRGMVHAHIGWVFQADKPKLARSVPDLVGDPTLLLIDSLYLFWVVVGILIPAVALGWYHHSWHGFFAGMIWGGVVRICLLQHVTWSVNSVCHVWGGRPFNSADHSTNNLPVALLSLGEGWHNNHHAFPTSARHGLRWYQFDPSYVIISTLKRVGLAWDVRLPSPAALAAKAK